MLSRDQFVRDQYHELLGLVCDAAVVARHGVCLSKFISDAGKLVRDQLGAMYDALTESKRLDVPASDKLSEKKKVCV